MTEASRRTEVGGDGKEIPCSVVDFSGTCTLLGYLFFSQLFSVTTVLLLHLRGIIN